MESKRFLRVLIIMCAVLLFLTVPLTNVNAQAEKEPIRMGINMEFSGIMSETSGNTRQGYNLYLEEIGYKVAGRPINIIEYDNKSDTKISVEVTRKLLEKDKVHLLLFVTYSVAAIAGRGHAEKAEIPMIVFGLGGAERVNLPPSKYIFRTGYADGQMELALGRYAYEKLGFRKMAVMGPDYAGSTGKLWAFHQAFEKSGGKIVQTILWPLGEMDMAPHFARLQPNVEAVYPFLPGDISINRFISQYFQLGLDKKIKLCTHWTFTEDFYTLPIFKDKMIGIISGSYYNLNFDSPENKRVTEMYYAKYGKKQLMCLDVATGYEGMKFVCKALDAIGGKVEDTEAFLKAMHTTKMKGLVSSAVSVDENGNAVRDFVIRQVQKKDGVIKNVVLDVIRQVHQPPQGYTIMPGK
jgi:branched-chain amino acid transport system substrate-binding protein